MSPSFLSRLVAEGYEARFRDSARSHVRLSLSTVSFNQSYSYVGNGNRWVSNNGGSTPLPITPETPQAATAYSSSTVPNRINTWTYDQDGNIWTIPLVGNTSRNFTYDAESRTVSATIVTGTGTTSASYVYDGLGQRVSKTVNGQTTMFVYNAFGNLMAEYGGASTPPCDTPTCYLTVDHLGSTRLITDTAGLNGTASSTVVRYDYQPFGGEITANYGNRTNAMGYLTAPDATGPKYTGKYRDFETTLDWFDVRHNSGAQGRFQSVDPGNAGANPADPQTWNAYAYVGNNPLSSTDPSGMGETAPLCAAGPIVCAIGIGIEVGLTLWDIFDHRGGSNTQLGPVTNNTSEPWSEQIPYDTGSGGTNIGGVYGDGSMGPFIFSFADQTLGGPGPSNNPYDRAYSIFLAWVFGAGGSHRGYTNSSVEGRDLMRSKGFQQGMQGVQKVCQAGGTSGPFNLGTYRAAGNLQYDLFHSPTGAYVGGYVGDFAVRGNSVNIEIRNDLTVSSFMASAFAGWHPPHSLVDRAPDSGSFGTIHQTFTLSAANPCAK